MSRTDPSDHDYAVTIDKLVQVAYCEGYVKGAEAAACGDLDLPNLTVEELLAAAFGSFAEHRAECPSMVRRLEDAA